MAAAYIEARLGSGELAESSSEVIGVVLGQWLRFVEHRHASTWTTEEVVRWVHDQTVRPSTRKSRLTKLRPFARWLVLRGVMDTDPTLGVPGVKIPVGNPRDLHEDDVRQLLRVCPDDRAVMIVLLMAQMGLRCGDIARARIEDIDARRRVLGCRARQEGGPGRADPLGADPRRGVDRARRPRRRDGRVGWTAAAVAARPARRAHAALRLRQPRRGRGAGGRAEAVPPRRHLRSLAAPARAHRRCSTGEPTCARSSTRSATAPSARPRSTRGVSRQGCGQR